MLQGRHGSIEVVYVARVPSVDMMSADALVGVEADFDQIEKELRASAAAQLDGRGIGWDFQRRQGLVAAELIAAASAVVAAHPGDTVVIAGGNSSHARHRVLARSQSASPATAPCRS